MTDAHPAGTPRTRHEAAAAAAGILARLVAFDTTSRHPNRDLVDYVAAYLSSHGIDSQQVPTPDGLKASLFATIGPRDTPGIALSGHTDVVPVDGQAWDTNPFELVRRDGRLYGRGTADMKGFLACVLAAVPGLTRRRLRVPFHVVFSYDEEIGCVGVRPMLAEFGGRLPRPRFAIVGEPTGMTVVDAHKGPVRWAVEVSGRPVHSSMAHLGVNAITYAGRLLGELERMERDLAALAPDARFDPPYPTLQVTELAGGTASNIVPVSCRFGFEVRALPGLDIDAIGERLRVFAETRCLPEMRRVAPEADISIRLANHVPPFAADGTAEVVALALRLLGQNRTHAVSYATEAGLFQDAGVPSIVCGPGSITEAHTANEWIAESEIDRCLAFLDALAGWAEG